MSNAAFPDVLHTHHVVGVYRNVVDTGWIQDLQASAKEKQVADIHDADKVRLHLFTDHEIDAMQRYPFESEAIADDLQERAASETATSTIQCVRKGLWVIERTGGIVVNLAAAKVFNAERNDFGNAFEELTGFDPLTDNRGLGLHIGRVAAGATGRRALEIIEPSVPRAISLLPVKVKTIPRAR